MILGTLHRRLFARYLALEPGDTGGTDTGAAGLAPAIDASDASGATSTEQTESPPAVTPEAPTDPAADLRALMDRVGADPADAGQPRDALGRFAIAGPAASSAPAPQASPGTPAAAPVVPAAPGSLDLTPPEGMNERTQARWSALTERVKGIPAIEQRAQEAQSALESVRQLVSQTGLQPQEFTELLDITRASRSSDPGDMRRALQYLDAARTDLALRLGVDPQTTPDPLAQHPDLQQKVGSMLLTREDALELARLRAAGHRAEQANQQQVQEQQFRASIETASSAMQTTLAARATEPGHAQKVQAIQQHFANPQNLQRFVTTYQPQQWVAALTWMYDHTQVPVAAPASVASPAAPQPLRPGTSRAGAAVPSGPVTAESALAGALASIGM